jgi:hypothetical protein
MKVILSATFLFAMCCFADHVIPAGNYGPPYLYPANPADRLYKIPLAAGRSTYISGAWCTDPYPTGYHHADFSADFDETVGRFAYCARAGRVLAIEAAPGGLPSYYTIQIGRVDSMPDSTSLRASGYRLIQTRDYYRHLDGATKLVNLGDNVVQGQPIAAINSVGHVHFEVNVSGWTFVRPIAPYDSLLTSIPVAFQEITVHPQGFPELYDTYVSQNTPIGAEKAIAPLSGIAAFTLFPNPFRPSASVHFNLREKCGVSLEVFDASGRLVERLLAGSVLSPGDYGMAWSAPDLPSGPYVFRLKAGGGTVSRRVHKVK